jgi:hypothetical protein
VSGRRRRLCAYCKYGLRKANGRQIGWDVMSPDGRMYVCSPWCEDGYNRVPNAARGTRALYPLILLPDPARLSGGKG